MSKTKLYSYWRSSCSYRVRIALNLKGIDHDIVAINLVKDGGEQYTAKYTQVNPMNQVPTLTIDDINIMDSINILEYLEDTRPQVRLMPEDPKERVKVRSICAIISSGIQPLQNLGVLKKIGERKTEWARDAIERGFKAVETLLEEYAGEYCVGDNITMADCCLVPQVYNANRFQVDLKPYPNIVRIDLTLKKHPAFITAHPDSQPDAQLNA